MDGWEIVICTLLGAVVGGAYGLIVSLRSKSKQKKQAENNETVSKPKRFNPVPLIVMVFIAIASIVTVHLLHEPAPRVYKEKMFSKSGLTITLNDGFNEKELVSYTAAFDSKSIAVFVIKEDFSSIENKNLSLEEYAELVINNNKLDVTVEKTEGLTSFTFEKHTNGKDYIYFATVYKSYDAYWILQFSCESAKFESLKALIIQYAKSVNV